MEWSGVKSAAAFLSLTAGVAVAVAVFVWSAALLLRFVF